MEERPGRQQGLVIEEGGSLSLQGVGQARLASAVAPGVPVAAGVPVGVGRQLPSPTFAPEMTLAQNCLSCHGPG